MEQVVLSSDLPMQGVRQGEGINLPGREGGIGVRYKRVDPGYFSTLDIPLLAGRGISAQDRAGAPRVVVINEVLAAQMAEQFEMDSPVGKVINMSTPNHLNCDGTAELAEVGGIIRNERTDALDHEPNVWWSMFR